MDNLFNLAGSAISGAASVLGIPWQKKMQEELMHENEAINLAQWNRENKYNSPKEQMARLREAGLNPDLAISGNVANTAGNAQLTTGTPQAPGAASAVSQAVRNAQSAAMMDSEINKNESEANRNNAQAGEHEANTSYKWRSMDLAIEKLGAEVGFTKQQTMEAVARTNLFGVQVEETLTQIQNLHAQIRLTNARVLGQYQENRLTAFNADLAYKTLTNYETMFNATLNDLFADIGLKKSMANQYSANASLIWNTMKSQVSYWENLSDKTAAEIEFLNAGIGFRDAQTTLLTEQLKYLPYQNAEMMFYAEKYFDKDDKGEYIIGSNGVPKLRQPSVLWGRILDQVGGGVKIVGEAAGAIFSFGVGAAGIKGAFKGFNSVKGGAASSSAPFSYNLNADQFKAYQRWQNASSGADKQRAYNAFMRTLD